MATTQNKNRPDYCNAAYTKMLAALKIVRDAFVGTLAIRDARTEYLPKNPQEEDGEYNARLARSVFLPAFKRVVTLTLGLIFHKDPTVKDVEQPIEDHLANIDLSGTNLAVFARSVARAAVRDGHAFIYVDMPPALEQSDTLAAQPTLKDEREAGLRPYWVLYTKEQAVNWRTANVNGQTVLTQITFKECSYEPDGDFGEKAVVRYRVLTPGLIRVFKQVRAKGPVEQEGGDIATSLNYIPVFPVYGGEAEEPFESVPPLLDLALLNVQHYQSASDLHNILHVANVPILWARDRNTAVKFQAVGPSILIDLKGEHSEIGYAEHQGKAIGKAQEEIDRIEKRMTMAGFELMADKASGPETATGEIKDAAESDSQLSLLVKSLQGALNNALATHAEYLSLETKGAIDLNVEYERLVLSVEEMRVLRDLANDKLLTVRSMLELLKRAGKLGPDFDVDKEMEGLFGADLADKSEIEREAALAEAEMQRQQKLSPPQDGGDA